MERNPLKNSSDASFSPLLLTSQMFNSLKNKWKVSGTRLVLIIATFAIGGSLTGYAAKKIMNVLSIRQDWLWTLLYIALIIILWPLAVILLSLFTGQYRFFRNYISRIFRFGKQLSADSEQLASGSSLAEKGGSVGNVTLENYLKPQTSNFKLSIFASGAGSNAQNIIDHFRDHLSIKVVLILSNNPNAGVLEIARKEKIPFIVIEKERFFMGDAYIPELEGSGIDLIILAGFLWKIPDALVRRFEKRIINIHPALLPAFGGKGMYGPRVHDAVLSSGKKESGITIHYVDEVYDNGAIIFQATCPVYKNDTIGSLTKRIHELEHEHYPKVIEELLRS
jgi:formyltetrahydrofolate-dependent phosphoribosylglycinamide formyltransferase